MWYKKFIQGKLLTQVIENDIFDIKDIEEAAKITIDREGLLKIFEEYSSKSEKRTAKVQNK